MTGQQGSRAAGGGTGAGEDGALQAPGTRAPRGRGSPGAAAKSSALFAFASHRASPGAALSAHDSRSTDVLDKSRG